MNVLVSVVTIQRKWILAPSHFILDAELLKPSRYHLLPTRMQVGNTFATVKKKKAFKNVPISYLSL